MNKSTVVLFGAGAVIPWGAPTTLKITEKICSDNTFMSRTGQPLGAWVYDKLRQFYHRDPESVNFETILNAIDWLCTYYTSELRQGFSEFKTQIPVFFSAKESLDEILDFNRIYRTQHQSWYCENPRVKFYGSWQDYDYFFEAIYRLYINLIIEEIDKYEKEVKNSKFDNINNLFNSFLNDINSNSLIRAYTLNYDRFIPLVSSQSFFEGFTNDADAKLKFDRTKVLRENNFNCFYNLHGSIHYEQDWPNYVELQPARVIYNFGHGSSSSNDQESRKLINSNIITGLNKSSRMLQNPYSQYYHSFYQDCLNADTIYIVGYSFSDIHINKVIKEGSLINSDQKIVVTGYDVIPQENINVYTKKNDLFSLGSQDRHIWLSTHHGTNNIVDQNNKNRIIYFRKGFQNFLEWKIWDNI